VSYNLPQGWVNPEPVELRVSPAAPTDFRAPLKLPADLKPGKYEAHLSIKHAQTETVAPLTLRVTPRGALCPRARKAPEIDGKLEDDCWQTAPEVGAFVSGDGSPIKQATSARLTWDDQRLYLAVSCAEDRMGVLRQTLTGRDAPVWTDDDVAIMLNFGGVFYKLEVNPAGAFYDAREGDPTWNGDWQIKTSLGERGWVVEGSLGWAAVGWRASEGLTFGINFCRQEKPHSEVSYWIAGSINDGWNVGAATLAP
jgi:hypothetical protein